VISLQPLQPEDRNQFILDNQEAFRYGAMEEFGMRDDHFEEDGEIIDRSTIEACLDHPNAEAYRIMKDGESVGGMVLCYSIGKAMGCHNSLSSGQAPCHMDSQQDHPEGM